MQAKPNLTEEEIEAQIISLTGEATRKAYQQALAAGLAVIARDRKILRIHADGREECVGELAPLPPSRPGRLYGLRRRTS